MKYFDYKDAMDAISDRIREETPAAVTRIVGDVRARGDEAVCEYTRLLDGCPSREYRVPNEEIGQALRMIPEDLRAAMQQSVDNLRRFSRAQLADCRSFDIEVEPGVVAGQRVVPICRVGVYVPGGRYPLVSSLLMGAVPAREAGVEEIVVCSPPRQDGSLPKALLAAAGLADVNEIYAVGGSQAIAAMAYGTETLPAVDKIVGPGNRYVTAAKRLVYGKVGIDFIAGPTEILIIADHTTDPVLAAADLLAQAEHDVDARCVLVVRDPELLNRVELELDRQLSGEPEASPVRISLDRRGWGVVAASSAQAVSLANRLAPEHLELLVDDPDLYLDGLRNYGSLFVGPWSAGVLGDYSSGLNHVLPTAGASRYTGGLGVRDFIKFQTVLTASRKGFQRIGPTAKSLAQTEGLVRHAKAVDVRVKGDLYSF